MRQQEGCSFQEYASPAFTAQVAKTSAIIVLND